MNIPLPALRQIDIDRFNMKTQQGSPNECWPWKGATYQSGYGMVSIKRKIFRAPRIAYFLQHSVDPGHLCVLHKCDNPKCVNPNHLYAGNSAQNVRDRVERGRSCRGEQHVSAILNTKDVRFILASPLTADVLASTFGVSESTIRSIRARRIWKHIQCPNDLGKHTECYENLLSNVQSAANN
jgi:hypothetical protein